MSLYFPYTYISCPCSDSTTTAFSSKRISAEIDIDQAIEQDDSTFDSRRPRAAFSLFPPEHLFYCEGCRDLKCPRCVNEEIICWYCPQCLFESPPSSVKSDGNRCPRNCYVCPICLSQLTTSALNADTSPRYVLNCQYCMWTSLDIGVTFSNAQGIRNQMEGKSGTSQIRPSGLKNQYASQQGSEDTDETARLQRFTNHQRFNALKSFYKEQLLSSDANTSSSVLDAAFSSPSSLTRLMNLYGSSSGVLNRKSTRKTTVMREALTQSEGLQIASEEVVQAQASDQGTDYIDIPTTLQLESQYPSPIGNPNAKCVSQLKPMPALLRTKRSKRCAMCKHILVKPELKVTSTRYRIKLVALNYIPFVSVQPVPVSGGLLPAGPDGSSSVTLTAGKPSHWILTLRNPLFESVNISLGSPSVTPGKYGHKVTILCPEFTLGKNGDVWDDALKVGAGLPKSDTQVSMGLGSELVAGKVYDTGRNWTSVVIEIIPASIVSMKDEVLEEDEDVVEVPIRIRQQWKITDEQVLEDSNARRKAKEEGEDEADDGTRELTYWMVLGIGRVVL